MTDGDEFQRNERNAGFTSSEFRITRTPKAGERHVSRGGILKYNWRLSPTRAKRSSHAWTDRPWMLCTPEYVRRARGWFTLPLYFGVSLRSFSRDAGRVKVDASAPLSTRCVGPQARFTRKLARHSSCLFWKRLVLSPILKVTYNWEYGNKVMRLLSILTTWKLTYVAFGWNEVCNGLQEESGANAFILIYRRCFENSDGRSGHLFCCNLNCLFFYIYRSNHSEQSSESDITK